jgi:hypothetical protein
MTPFELIMAVIAVALLIAVTVLIRLSLRIGRSADDVAMAARRLTELTPFARELIQSSRAEVEALRGLTKNSAEVVRDVRSVSAQASAVSSQLLLGLESELTDRLRALFRGARAGVEVLRHHRNGHGVRAARSTMPEDSDHSST